MFGARGMHVHSWAGANLLGGGDGATLADPQAVQSKLASKTRGLRSLVGEHVVAPLHIDNVPDLGDIKTAWDHINAEGFLGSRITMQTIWSAYDSMLAAPLVLDLARLLALADAQASAASCPSSASSSRTRGAATCTTSHADHRADRVGAGTGARCRGGAAGRDRTLTTAGDVLELVRAPAALTVIGDTMAGGHAGGARFSRRQWLLPLASVFLYSGGMALNDYADRELDAVERPERPIPSGRVAPRRALGIAAACMAVGLGLAATGGGRRALTVAVPLVGAIVAYNTVLKDTAIGPVTMAACRGLDVMMGAGGARAAAPAAATVALHTAGVTAQSRGEVHGGSVGVARAGLAVTGATTIAAVAPAGARRPGRAASAGARRRRGRRLPRRGAAEPADDPRRSVGRERPHRDACRHRRDDPAAGDARRTHRRPPPCPLLGGVDLVRRGLAARRARVM